MSDLSELYQEVILDHNKNPRNFRMLEHPDREAEGNNPLCGDQVKIFLKVRDGVIEDVSFKGAGCAISTASASIMTEAVKGKTVEQAEALFEAFRGLVTARPTEAVSDDDLGKLAVFHGVSEYPIRVKCATLAWHTLLAAIHQKDAVVSTE